MGALLALGLGVAGTGAAASAVAASAAPPASAPADADDPVAALGRDAHALRSIEPHGDLRDLRPLGAMVADAQVVGLGEATHGSREFFTMKHRVFRYLVEEKGFTTFSLETGWSGGVRLNEYVRHGTGDLDQIMQEELQDSYRFWRTTEYRDFIEWMRDYNSRHATQVQFMGNDLGYAGPELLDRVTGYVRAHHPTLLAQFMEAYRDLRPTTDAGTWMSTYPGLPIGQRQAVARTAQQAMDALAATHATSEEFTWTVQHARAIAQVATLYSFDLDDPAKVRDAMLYRDQVMAENTAWWHEQTGAKILVSAHNGHVGYESHEPEQYPRMQGAFLRDRLGAGYVSVGFTFHHGSFNAEDENDQLGTFAVSPAGAGSNEYVLDEVALRDYLLDLRSAPAAARAWLAEPRATRSIGTAWPQPDRPIALGRTHDILIHLHRVQAAHLLG
ncbi:erythromycin esterase family protein [Pseudonocardia sp. DSM 110487]|uniref:erythromycin esterase family protein n=1 Tax=Pseudonocardia sp. DSM 110487 TaxID=2865833 RepID=UPI001C69C9D5|nr:erythromycin esterase family protein [Pseudonocardia sp. DSM 110487]QYN38114.1 erythromycin esterase family protein [Pseudonocardia sp. DSM 110487]